MNRLPVSLMLAVVVAIFGVGIALDSLFERFQGSSNDTQPDIGFFAADFARLLDNSPTPDNIIDQWPESHSYDIQLIEREELPLPVSLQASFETGDALELETQQGISLNLYLPRHDKVLSIQQSNSTDDDGIAWVFTSVFYLGTLGVVLLWLKPLLNRLHLVRESAKAFGEGQLDSRIDTQGISYIRDIEDDFNRMAEKIQQLIDDNKLLTSAVSHDLRTPFARLRFGIDMLDEAQTGAARKQYMERIKSDMSEMESLLESLLHYAKLDHVMAGVQRQKFSIRNLSRECVAQFHDSDIEVVVDESSLETDDTVVVNGCIEHLATLINNLVGNALKYARKQVIVKIERKGGDVIMSFCDDGPGIPEALRQQVMKPFERSNQSSEQGYGLGLAVAVRIAEHHEGGIEILGCSRLGGALVRVRLRV